jgi:hypothetical protein
VTSDPISTQLDVFRKLLSGQYLGQNEQLVSPNGKTRLILQNDGNLRVYRIDTGAFLWGSGTDVNTGWGVARAGGPQASHD